jgi:ATP-binding cassette subfamily B protein
MLRNASRRISSLWRRRLRVPVIHQLSMVECGAACLAMILSYYGRKTTVAECRERCSPGRDGLTARGITRAARDFGLEARAFSIAPAALNHITLPVIAHWQGNHFVIIERRTDNTVHIVDPSAGRRRMTRADFEESFTSVVLAFERGPDFQTASGKRTRWTSHLKSMLATSGTKQTLARILLASLLMQVLALLLPAFTKVVIDQVLPRQLSNLMPILGVGMIILAAGQIVTGYLRSLSMIHLRGRLDSQLMLGFVRHLLSLRLSFFQQRTSGDLLMRLGSNSLIRELLTSQILSVILDGLFVLGYLAILLALAPFFGLVVVGLGLIQVTIILLGRGRLRLVMQRDLATKADEQSYLVEVMKGISFLKFSGAEERAFDRWSALFFEQLNAAIQRGRFSAMIEAAMGAVRALSPLLLLWLGATSVLDGEMSLGTMLALNAVAGSFLAPLTTLASNAQQLQVAGANIERIADALEAAPEQQDTMGLNRRLSGRISVDRVSFRYNPDSPLVLQEISFGVEPGQKIALVGATGSGKSTLAMLLLGLYRPDDGEIFYDGVPLAELNYRDLRSQIGVVQQEPFLFSGSVRQNIAFIKPDCSLVNVMEAGRIAEIHEDLCLLPMGYETIVAEGGTTLSGGQRQRLALARALIHRPAILMLDEATSHLDALTESRVDRNLSRLSCTRIVIAHRLSTVRNADLILVLDSGRIVEQGSHPELVAKRGVYAALAGYQRHNDPVDAGLSGSHAKHGDSDIDLSIHTGAVSQPSSGGLNGSNTCIVLRQTLPEKGVNNEAALFEIDSGSHDRSRL